MFNTVYIICTVFLLLLLLFICSINIKGLSKSTDIQSLAGFLVSQTPLISSKRLPEIEQLLMYMLNRKLNKPGFQGINIINIIITTRASMSHVSDWILYF